MGRPGRHAARHVGEALQLAAAPRMLLAAIAHDRTALGVHDQHVHRHVQIGVFLGEAPFVRCPASQRLVGVRGDEVVAVVRKRGVEHLAACVGRGQVPHRGQCVASPHGNAAVVQERRQPVAADRAQQSLWRTGRCAGEGCQAHRCIGRVGTHVWCGVGQLGVGPAPVPARVLPTGAVGTQAFRAHVVQLGPLEARLVGHGVVEHHTPQPRAGEVGAGEIGPAEVQIGEGQLAQVGAPQRGAGESGLRQRRQHVLQAGPIPGVDVAGAGRCSAGARLPTCQRARKLAAQAQQGARDGGRLLVLQGGMQFRRKRGVAGALPGLHRGVCHAGAAPAGDDRRADEFEVARRQGVDHRLAAPEQPAGHRDVAPAALHLERNAQ